METLYERIQRLCKEKGITGGRMCTELGISKGTITDLKAGRKKGLSAVNAQKIASYLGVTVGYLLGEESLRNEKEQTQAQVMEQLFELLKHSDMLKDEEYIEMYSDFQKLTSRDKIIIKMLIKNLVNNV